MNFSANATDLRITRSQGLRQLHHEENGTDYEKADKPDDYYTIKSNVAPAHPTAAELRGITIEINYHRLKIQLSATSPISAVIFS